MASVGSIQQLLVRVHYEVNDHQEANNTEAEVKKYSTKKPQNTNRKKKFRIHTQIILIIYLPFSNIQN
jgi:hypothetical protein